MAHFAKIGLNSKVMGVHVVNDSDILDGAGVEDETVGQQFLEKLHGWPASMWKQTSYNTYAGTHSSGDNSKALRGNYAGIGMTYDEDNNIFYGKKPYASWTLNTTTATWEAPTPMPSTTTDGYPDDYTWNESTKAWDKVVV